MKILPSRSTAGFSVIVFILLVIFPPPICYAHDDPNASVPSLGALKTDAPLKADGILDEPFWKDAETGSNFIDMRTDKPAKQQTLVRVAYTRTHIYVAVECLDDKIGDVHASEQREDREFKGDDWVEVHFDPIHTHRSKYAFFSNPLGTRADASEGPSGVFNRGWTADWELGAKILEDRWVFEMSIPLKIMNYNRKDGQTWGLNFTRFLVRTDETSFWSFNPTNFYKPRYFGHLTGLDLADSEFDRNWEITPYISSRLDYNSDTDAFFQTGVDVGFRLTPSITTAWTLNPDFGQVEADDDTIELRDTERFLPEKRLFFREGDELMNMQHMLYYSRRFTDIEAGARVSGNWDDYKFAYLNIQGDATHDETRHGNSSVFRLLQGVGEKSTLGYYLTDSEFDDGHSRAASMDSELFITDDFKFRSQTTIADDRNEDDLGTIAKDSIDYLGNAAFVYDKYPWNCSMGYLAITNEFNPTLGYIPRRDIFGPAFFTSYRQKSDDRWYKDFMISFNTAYYENGGGETALRDYKFDADVIFHNDYGVFASQDFDYHAPYRNTRSVAGVSMNNSDYWKSMDISYGVGEFEETYYDEITFGKRIKPFERLPIRYEFTIRFEDKPTDENDTIWLNRIVFDYYFTDRMWVKTSLQHRSNNIHNVSVIYGWEFVKNAHWYMVFNSVDHGAGDEEAGQSVFTKIVYTF
ncbi:MAG: DUF5916 domain-containing protein [Candidatus Omnitrophota bacterium]